jgi:hypothetical protein
MPRWEKVGHTLHRYFGYDCTDTVPLSYDQDKAISEYKADLQSRFDLRRAELEGKNYQLVAENERLRFQIDWLAKQPIYKGVFDLECPQKATPNG